MDIGSYEINVIVATLVRNRKKGTDIHNIVTTAWGNVISLIGVYSNWQKNIKRSNERISRGKTEAGVISQKSVLKWFLWSARHWVLTKVQPVKNLPRGSIQTIEWFMVLSPKNWVCDPFTTDGFLILYRPLTRTRALHVVETSRKLSLEETSTVTSSSLMRNGFTPDLSDAHKPCDHGYRLMDLETEEETPSVQRWSGRIWQSSRWTSKAFHTQKCWEETRLSILNCIALFSKRPWIFSEAPKWEEREESLCGEIWL